MANPMRPMSPLGRPPLNRRQVRPPSVVLNTPRSGFGFHRLPRAATYAMSGLVGCTMTLPMCRVSTSPRWVHVLPASVERYMPLPHEVLWRLFCSPVPAQITSGLDGEIATSPKVLTGCPSKIGVQVVPLLVVFHKPPDAVAT